ncbi:putative hydroxymethylpyrimidine transporter CytX [Acetobacterium paludosum]|uniref:Hydroxymethylpyrimidine transporter CytX n=1 Tax=Acetobacterium paludosum TaxID=52693 RepID=A0A923HVM5_9FIRM|nr:putative hydroxymethylpyrimidine transporter CytX [Acetobacterium paludosum]MBC3888070.1 putative hydroxymethylpyrimidine transporter CytX [Acetobacterium paludosum]
MQNENKLSNRSLTLLWLGAAISIAEVMTGTLIAPLGLKNGVIAIIIGHVIGISVLFLAGVIGSQSKLPAIESSRISFGKYGSYIFSILNILQLIGWTAVMVITAAKAIDGVTASTFNYQNTTLGCIIIGVFIFLWVLVGFKNMEKLNYIAVGLLFIGSVILSLQIFSGSSVNSAVEGTMTFGGAVELSAIMPISWLPLIADYTRFSEKKKSGSLVSSISYFMGSCWMYIIGLGAALYAGTSDIFVILTSVGLGMVALIIILFSTVTTAFLDVYSAGVSFVNIDTKVKERTAVLITGVIGVLLAIVAPIDAYQDFLYLIGSVFAPLFAILITDYFVFKNTQIEEKKLLDIKNMMIWVVGVVIYRQLMTLDFPVGVTLPAMIIISLICILVNGGIKLCLKRS